MSESEYSAGPWVAQHAHAGGVGWEVANHGGRNRVCDNAREANAHLIAAAPELLAALEELVSINTIHLVRTGDNFAWAEMECAIEAIGKAKGGAE